MSRRSKGILLEKARQKLSGVLRLLKLGLEGARGSGIGTLVLNTTPA
jgi:hypothetical protein